MGLRRFRIGAGLFPLRRCRPRGRTYGYQGLIAEMKSRPVLAMLLGAVLAACGGLQPRQQGAGHPGTAPFRLESLAKSDIDTITEIHEQQALAHLRTLAEKLYRRNPRERRKSGQASTESALARLFDPGPHWNFGELQGKTGVDSVRLAFDADYKGDRVLAFIAGLSSMIVASYNGKTEFFILDELDPQKLYNSARNVEIAAWKLGTARDRHGGLYLLSDEINGPLRNLSFEREFGKIIGIQDTMAQVVADKTNRSIARVIQTLATAVFLPL